MLGKGETEMKCPKCGGEATFNEKIRFILSGVELDSIPHWGKSVIFERWIHFKCPLSETPNFVFYLEAEEEQEK